MRWRDAQHDVALLTPLKPHDVAGAWHVDAARDRALDERELRDRRCELGLLVLVGRARREAFGGGRDARDRVRHPLAGELHRQPAPVPGAQTPGDTDTI